MPEVSIVVPTQNRWGRVDLTLWTALGQAGVDFELIVVDDGSLDGSGLECLRRRLDDDRVQGVRLESARGMAAARNAGVARASAPWIAFLDDDDLWAPRKLAGQLRAVAGTDAAAAYSGVVVTGPTLRPVRVIAPPTPDTLATDLLGRNLIPAGASNLLVRRATLEAAGGFDESLRHLADWDAWIRIAEVARFLTDPEPSVAYVQHPGNYRSRDPGGVLCEVEVIRRRHGERARAAGVSIDEAELTRWLAASALRARRRGQAARLYWRSAWRDRDAGNAARALYAASRLPDPRAWRTPEVPWLTELRVQGRRESLSRF